MGRRLPTDASFNGIEIADPAQGFRRYGRTGGLGNLVELASCVCPTGSENDVAIAGQMLEASIAVYMTPLKCARCRSTRSTGDGKIKAPTAVGRMWLVG
jgi:hypothetical protein